MSSHPSPLRVELSPLCAPPGGACSRPRSLEDVLKRDGHVLLLRPSCHTVLYAPLDL